MSSCTEAFQSSSAAVLAIVVVMFLPDRSNEPSKAELDQREKCAPLVWRLGMDQAGWGLLIANGYDVSTAQGQPALYPPGCDSSQQN